jgi:DNA-binding MltR family transcriptional regulator
MDERTSVLRFRVDRANKVIAALEAETDRGRACVGDAFIDELLKELFRRRLIDRPKLVEELLGVGRALGSFSDRLKLAYALGWIGEETLRDCETIHKIRNAMAHNLDVDSFDRPEVRGKLDALHALSHVKARLARRRDKFALAVQFAALRIWVVLDKSKNSPVVTDAPIMAIRPDNRT